jgi:hypothetical protein
VRKGEKIDGALLNDRYDLNQPFRDLNVHLSSHDTVLLASLKNTPDHTGKRDIFAKFLVSTATCGPPPQTPAAAHMVDFHQALTGKGAFAMLCNLEFRAGFVP